MPRKLRHVKQRVAALPSSAWTFDLLTGADPGCRLPGWPALFQQHVGEPTADEVWTRHHDALLDEAHRHDFEPYWQRKRRPRGAGFQRWRDHFLAAHRY